MEGSYRLVVEDAPPPADLALLEDRVAQAAIAAAGLGDDEEFGIFVRDDDGTVVAGISGIVWGGGCDSRRCGSTSHSAAVGWPARSWRVRKPKPDGGAAGSSSSGLTTCSPPASTSGSATRPSA